MGERRIELGRRFGTVTGHVVPHELATQLTQGQRVVAGQGIAYNSGFLTPDWRDPTQFVTTPGPLANIVLMENNHTFEDASLISKRYSERLKTRVSHTRTLLVNFNEGIRDLVTEGMHLNNDDILAYIEDQTTAAVGNFDSDSLETLRRLGTPAPRSKFLGDVEQIEVFYFGDKEDMSPSVRAIADKYDEQRAKRVKALDNHEALTGQILTPTRVDGLELEMDQMAIRIYITHERGMGDGDKLVVGNQKKSVVSGVFDGVFRTNGEVIPGQGKMDIDLQFSYRAINARIVPSALLFGMSSILVATIEQKMLDAYDSE